MLMHDINATRFLRIHIFSERTMPAETYWKINVRCNKQRVLNYLASTRVLYSEKRFCRG